MTYIVDRIEDGIAVLEDENMKHTEISSHKLPENAKEGSVLILNSDGSFTLDEAQTQKIKQKMLDLQKKLFKK